MKMKRILCTAISCILLLLCAAPTGASAAAYSPTRVINVVYDDSGSMYSGVDTWCRAKYSMEVFSAMLGDADKMNVYYMSDYCAGSSAPPRISLDGADGPDVNVAKIHNQKTVADNTPFNAVKKAYSDLNSTAADEKWLVILTDGEFEDGRMSSSEIDSFLAGKSRDVKVMFLGMGKNAAGITEDAANNIFYVEATTNAQILSRITEICTRVFNSNKLELNVSTKTCSFDVPMAELTVFAQGANVEITGIKRSDGSSVRSSRTPVEVKYSECDATNYSRGPVTDLLGKIATFKDDFLAGDYTVEVSGAETVEIYYRPNIAVTASLTDGTGQSVTDLSTLAAGEYTISFGIVKAGTSDPVASSTLLGDISYEAVVTNNGVTHDTIYSDGDKIQIKEGPLIIDVTARYLDYNTVTTSLAFDVYKDKEISFSIENDPAYVVSTDGFIGDPENIRIKAKIDGRELSQEQWGAFSVPQIQLADDKPNFKIQLSDIEKSSEPGIFEVKPSFPNGKPSTGTYCDVNYRIIYRQQLGSETWQGEGEGILKLTDERSWWERNWDLAVKLTISLSVLFVLVGYLPFIKHYLPKSLKKKPYIKCIPSEPGEKRKDRNGVIEKNLLSTIIPYVPQTGSIKYVPKGVTGCPLLSVKAIKHHRMSITNVKAFAGKDYITFDGEAIKKEVKKFETGAGVSIRVKRGEWTYVCSPNQSN